LASTRVNVGVNNTSLAEHNVGFLFRTFPCPTTHYPSELALVVLSPILEAIIRCCLKEEVMSTVSPAASTPPRRRGEGHWGTYSYDYDNSPPYSHHGGPPPGGPPRGPGGHYGGPPPPYGGPNDYWSYDHAPPRGSGYWGPPPPSPYENYLPPPPGDRSMPPPSRGPPPRGPTRPSLSHEESPPTPHMRIPNSPGGSFHRGPPPLQPRHGDFIPPPPKTSRASSREESSAKDKKKGDPLSILANVSADMTSNEKKKSQQPPQTEAPRPSVPMPAPTSPLQRRSRPSPITPNQTSPGNKQRSQRHQVTPSGHSGAGPAGRTLEQPPSWDYGQEPGFGDHPPPPAYYPPRRRHPGYEYPPRYSDGGPPPGSPALVERGSFDSQGGDPYRDRPPYGPAPPQYHYDDHGYGYWEGGPPAYPPPRYNHYEWGGYDVPPEEGYYRTPPPPPPMAPYTMVQQPRLEEKTILRKKFSWKHYPEVSICSDCWWIAVCLELSF